MDLLAKQPVLRTSGRISLYEGNLLVLTTPEAMAFGVEDVHRDFKNIAELAQGTPVLLLVDARSTASMSIGARRLIGSDYPIKYGVLAAAVLTDSALSRIIADFQMRFHPPPIPMRLFTSEQAALDWLGSVPIPERNAEAG